MSIEQDKNLWRKINLITASRSDRWAGKGIHGSDRRASIIEQQLKVLKNETAWWAAIVAAQIKRYIFLSAERTYHQLSPQDEADFQRMSEIVFDYQLFLGQNIYETKNLTRPLHYTSRFDFDPEEVTPQSQLVSQDGQEID